MEILEFIKNAFWFVLSLSIIGLVFAGGFIGFIWVLGKFV